MYVIGKDSPTDKARRRLDEMSLREKRDYFKSKSCWLLFFNACFELGEITKDELIRLRKEALRWKLQH